MQADTGSIAEGAEVQQASALSLSPSLSLSALRVGLVALREVREGAELFAPYVSLSQPVEERRRELALRFPGRRPGVVGSAPAVADTGRAAPAFVPEASRWASSSPSMQQQQQQEQLSCSCLRCLFEAKGDHRSCGRVMLKVRASLCPYGALRAEYLTGAITFLHQTD